MSLPKLKLETIDTVENVIILYIMIGIRII